MIGTSKVVNIFFSHQQIIFLRFSKLSKSLVSIKNSIIGNLSNISDDKKWTDREKAEILIKNLLIKTGTNSQDSLYFNIALPDEYFYTRVIDIAEGIEDDEVKKIVLKQSEDLFPVHTRDLYIRWKKITTAKKLLVVAIPKKYLEVLINILTEKELPLKEIQPLSFLISRLVNNHTKKDYYLVFNNGSAFTCAVCINREVVFTTFSKNLPSLDLIKDQLIKLQSFNKSHFDYPIKELWMFGFSKQKPELKDKGLQLFLLEDKLELSGSKTVFSALYTALSGFFFKNYEEMNFSPKKCQRFFQKASFALYLHKVLYFFTLGMVILNFVLLFFNLKIYYNWYSENKQLESVKNSRISQLVKDIENEAVNINKKTKVIDFLYNQKIVGGGSLNNIYQIVPAGITLTAIDYNPSAKTMKFKGLAYSRDDLLTFRDKMNTLGTISIPITNFVQNKNINFTASLNLQ